MRWEVVAVSVFAILAIGRGQEAKAAQPAPIFWSGQQLHDEIESSVAIGFIMGVSDAIALSSEVQPYCVPESGGSTQLTAVVRRYLETNPEKWHESAALVILRALTEAFPCNR